MDLSDRVLGASVTKQLREKATAPVLRIGKDSFDRGVLARVECYNFTAAANLSNILNEELQVKDTKEVFDKIPPQSLVLPRLGSISLAVLGAAFEAKGLGGEAPLESWVRKHQPKDQKDYFLTFSTLKHQQHQRAAEEKKAARRRRASPSSPSPSSTED